MELIHSFVQDVCDRPHALDPAGDLSGERDTGLKVAAKINVLSASNLAENILNAVFLDPDRPFGA